MIYEDFLQNSMMNLNMGSFSFVNLAKPNLLFGHQDYGNLSVNKCIIFSFFMCYFFKNRLFNVLVNLCNVTLGFKHYSTTYLIKD